MRAIVCGSRSLTDRDFVFAELDQFKLHHGLSFVIEGGQRLRVGGVKVGGVDWLAKQWAQDRRVQWRTVKANWADLSHPDAVIKKGPNGRYDAMAGPRRNLKMLREFGPDAVIAFPGGAGTSDMMKQARAEMVRVFEVTR